MGTMTRGELIAHAGLASGNDQTTTFVATWLNAWLQRTAKSWAWPTLKMRLKDIPTVAGQMSIDVGLGYATPISVYIHRIFNPLFYRSSDYRQRGRILIRQLLDGNPDNDETVTLPANRLGAPSTCKIKTASTLTVVGVDPPNPSGAFSIFFDPVPDKVYYVTIDCHAIPAALASDASYPWYPSDRTLLQACKCALLEYDDGGEGGRAFNDEMMKLAAMVVDDRDFDGEGPGDNEILGLDKSVFL